MALSLEGKQVLVIKKDGFKKYGLLLKITEKYIVLQYADGKQEIIPFDALDSVKEARVGR